MGTKRTTIKDIAREVGLSPNTVSHALLGLPDISEATKKRVEAAAKKLNYIPNAAASMLRGSPRRRIGVLYSYHRNAFYWNMLFHIHRALSAAGYELMLLHTKYTADETDIRDACSRMIDGLIGLGDITEDGAQIVRTLRVPMVLIGTESKYEGIDSVYDDNYGGAFLATQHLIQCGYKNIAGMYLPDDIRNRYLGYEGACKKYGLPARTFIVKNNNYYCETDALLQAFPETDAVVCYNDFIAFDVLRRLKDIGRNNMGIIGYDALQTVLNFPHRMASIARDDAFCAKKAVEMLLTRKQNFDVATQKFMLDMKLVPGFDNIDHA